MSFVFVINRLDALIKRVEQLISAVTGKPVEGLPPIELPPPTVVLPQLPNRYKLFRVDLATARSKEPVGLKEILKAAGVPYATYMCIITVPAAFTFQVNSTDMDVIDAAIGLEWEDFEISEIFITNAVLAGIALIHVEYRVD